MAAKKRSDVGEHPEDQDKASENSADESVEGRVTL